MRWYGHVFLMSVMGGWLGFTGGLVQAAGGLMLENETLALRFSSADATLVAATNKLTGETYTVCGEGFLVEAIEFRLALGDMTLQAIDRNKQTLTARYRHGKLRIDVRYELKAGRHFFEKRLVITSREPYRLKRLVVSRPEFSATGLRIVPYQYQKNVTYFGRTPRGGFFTGIELPFDASNLDGGRIVLAYHPSLKVAAGERLESEPVYFGVYRRGNAEEERPREPLASEAEAMVGMTSLILGPPRHGLVPMACGWMSEMEHFAYRSEADVEAANRSLDFLAECGIDWLSDSHPWGGEIDKMNSLVDEQPYEIGPLVRRFLEHARSVRVNVVFWPTLNNTHPWWRAKGKPFRPDRPESRMRPDLDALAKVLPPQRLAVVARCPGNCFAHRPFREWLTRIQLQGLRSGKYKAWAIDGSFFGHGGDADLTLPANCLSADHDHLPGDSNYACERALNELTARLRREFPNIYIFLLRPPMDLGVWSLRNADACFTLHEAGAAEDLIGAGPRPMNVVLGDKIRTWSRIRVHRHFFPHYLDQPILFTKPASMGGRTSHPWSSEKLDYILLSALSCSPNLLFYLPTRAGIPDADKKTIRRWLDWGRENIRYLQVRKDLPQWPTAGHVDGSAHILGDRGFVFLFNPNDRALIAEFQLTESSIGLTSGGEFVICQLYPPSERRLRRRRGDSVDWAVPPRSVLLLQVAPQ